MSMCRLCHDFGLPQIGKEHEHPDTWEEVQDALDMDMEVRDADMDLVVDLDPTNDPHERYVWYVNKGYEAKRNEDGNRHRYRVDPEGMSKFRVIEPEMVSVVSQAEVDEAIESIQRVLTPMEERAHMVDDHERQRTAGRRPLRVAQDLLGDAVAAIKAGDADPAIDLVERALDRVNEAYAALDRTR